MHVVIAAGYGEFLASVDPDHVELCGRFILLFCEPSVALTFRVLNRGRLAHRTNRLAVGKKGNPAAIGGPLRVAVVPRTGELNERLSSRGGTALAINPQVTAITIVLPARPHRLDHHCQAVR